MLLDNEIVDSTPDQELEDALINDIAQGKCVLFLGPELLINKEGTYYKSYFKKFVNERSNTYKYFPKDNLFHISSSNLSVATRLLKEKIISFYKDAGDENILRLVSQLPFPLILNLAPDNGINTIFKENNLDFQPGYFHPKFKDELKKPTAQNPIIYNIFGSCEDTQSLIVNHNELFQRVKELMLSDSIPKVISTFLGEATSYVFLGIEFETWYYQLLLSVLKADNQNINPVRISTMSDSNKDIVSVMNSHFLIKFEKRSPLIFMQDLYNKIKVDFAQTLRTETPKPLSAASVYISYAWNDKNLPRTDGQQESNQQREIWVDKITSVLEKEYAIKILRDRNELTIGDSIKSFMNRIGYGKCVFIVVSDKYLKSEFCMYEALHIYQSGGFKDRVFLVVLPDVDKGTYGYYENNWKDKIKKLEDKIAKATSKKDFAALDSLIRKRKEYAYIEPFMGDFMTIIRDTLSAPENPDGLLSEKNFIPDSPGEIESQEFNAFIHRVVNHLNREE